MLPGGIFGAVDVDVLYSAFSVAGGTGADFSNVGAIDLGIFPDLAGTDLQIDFIKTDVPSPGPLALAGLAGILGTTRRRR
jgi:MYXO-CTERM domain-containing protein